MYPPGPTEAGPWGSYAPCSMARRGMSRGALTALRESPRKSLVAKIAAGFNLPGEGRADHHSRRRRGARERSSRHDEIQRDRPDVQRAQEHRHPVPAPARGVRAPVAGEDEFEVVVVDDNSPDGTGRRPRVAEGIPTSASSSAPARASSGSAPPTSTVSLTPRAISSSSWTPT